MNRGRFVCGYQIKPHKTCRNPVSRRNVRCWRHRGIAGATGSGASRRRSSGSSPPFDSARIFWCILLALVGIPLLIVVIL